MIIYAYYISSAPRYLRLSAKSASYSVLEDYKYRQLVRDHTNINKLYWVGEERYYLI